MRKIPQILLLIVFLTKAVLPVVKWVDYKLDIDKYEQYCENKEVEAIDCKGCCQVYKENKSDDKKAPMLNFSNEFSIGFINDRSLSKLFDNFLKPENINYSPIIKNLLYFNIDPPPPKVKLENS